ncbi:uncharacterized protein LOC143850292 [Tasmannia lanceolata]|uniref:uncharacterized protein LOC143850292 n=1 Tax=Tasmannia lanceolata TaxID=3420 RepID=UPI0040639630
MSLTVPLCSPQILHKTPTLTLITLPLKNSSRTHLCRTSLNDADLTSDLAEKMGKMKPILSQRKEAMKKSRELLFEDLCKYLHLREGEVKNRWREIGEVERLDLVRGFVAEWGVSFHPLSLRSVKDMVEEHLNEENPLGLSNPPLRFPSLKRMMGLSEAETR